MRDKRKTQIWVLKFIDDTQRYFIKALDTEGVINIWKEYSSNMDVMVEGSLSLQVAELLDDRDIPYTIAIGDVDYIINLERNSLISKHPRNPNIDILMDWNNYYPLATIYSFMNNLAQEYPYLCTVLTIGKTSEGRDLRVLKISNGNSNNTGVWVDGSIHAREWISAAVVTYLADHITRTFHELSDSVTTKDWYLLPVTNPDGYEYTHTHDRLWRKNRAQYGMNVGVDLNRNFSYGWGEKGEIGSSENPGNVFFRGPNPFSEAETSAVKHVILKSGTTFKVFISFHSYGEVVLFPWGYTQDPCPDYVELLEGGAAIAKAIFETNKRTYKVGSTKDLMYYACGTSIDWSYAVADITYSYMIELRSQRHRFLLPKEEIIPTAKESMNGVFSLLNFVDRRCKSTQSCTCPK